MPVGSRNMAVIHAGYDSFNPREKVVLVARLTDHVQRRRVKCGEEKPECLRCTRRGITCDGYPSRAYENEKSVIIKAADALSSPSCALADDIQSSPAEKRLMKLGYGLLGRRREEDFASDRVVFEYLIPQLGHMYPSVKAAATTLGAVYEVNVRPKDEYDRLRTTAAVYYDKALLSMRQDLQSRSSDVNALLVCCLLLVCAELLLNRKTKALIHFQGALGIFSGRTHPPRKLTTLGNAAAGSVGSFAPDIHDGLAVMLRTMDVHAVSYSDSLIPITRLVDRPPMLPSYQPTLNKPPLLDLTAGGIRLISIIHYCQFFMFHARTYKFVPQAHVPADLLIEQGRHIASLSLWLRDFGHDGHQIPPRAASNDRFHLLLLHSLCLSNLIAVSGILDPHETVWDQFAPYFRQIVKNADIILSARSLDDKQETPGCDSSGVPFNLSLGIIQPLRGTALKYRDPTWRRKAIDLLRVAGREGPWIGKLEAAAAQSVMQHEEKSACSMVDLSRDDAQSLAIRIPHRARLHGVIMDREEEDGCIDGSGVSQVRYVRCRDIEKLLAATYDPGTIPFGDHEHWEIWEEMIQY